VYVTHTRGYNATLVFHEEYKGVNLNCVIEASILIGLLKIYSPICDGSVGFFSCFQNQKMSLQTGNREDIFFFVSSSTLL
jgi:hypothetical protein